MIIARKYLGKNAYPKELKKIGLKYENSPCNYDLF
jgi:hypothetical protein